MKLSFNALILSFALAHLPASVQGVPTGNYYCFYVDGKISSGHTEYWYVDHMKKVAPSAIQRTAYNIGSDYECPKKLCEWDNSCNYYCYYVGGKISVGDYKESFVEHMKQKNTGAILRTAHSIDQDVYKCPSKLCEWDSNCPAASTSGDPHFKTWNGNRFDFHGGCDLVLLQNPNFLSGLGMHVHGRTEIHNWWSLIQSVVVQLGPYTIEVEGGANGSYYRINGGPKIPLTTGEIVIGDFSAHITQFNNHSAKVRIDLGHGDAMAIQTFKKFVRFDVSDKSGTAFSGSTGMFGSYPGGEKLARDGVTEIEDANEFGQEWMVRPTDAMLFYGANPSDLPMTCPMPETTMKEGRRRLGEAAISEEDAALACARVKEGDRDACIFDVLATNDKEMAGSY